MDDGRQPPESLWHSNSISSITRRSRDAHCPCCPARCRQAPHKVSFLFWASGQHQASHSPDLTTLGLLRRVSLTSVPKPSLSLPPQPPQPGVTGTCAVLHHTVGAVGIRVAFPISSVDEASLGSLESPPPESTSDAPGLSPDSCMGSRPHSSDSNSSHSTTRRRLDSGSKLFACSSLPCSANSSAASLPRDADSPRIQFKLVRIRSQ